MKLLNKFALILSLSMLVGIAQNVKSQESEIKPVAEFDKTTHDFGEVPQGTPVTATFKVKNSSMVPLVISDVKPTCGCTVADYPKQPIRPGETGLISATYNAKGVGPFTKPVKVYTNTSDGMITVYLKGVVKSAQPAAN